MPSREIEFMDTIIGYIKGNAYNLAKSGITRMLEKVPSLRANLIAHYQDDKGAQAKINRHFNAIETALTAANSYVAKTNNYKMPRDAKAISSLRSKALWYAKEARAIFRKMEKYEG